MTLTRIPLYLMTLLSILIALASYRFFGLGLETAFADMLGHLEARRTAFVLHVTFAPLALILGAIQLFPKVRAKRPNLHRWTGRFYSVAVLVAGLSGLVVATGAAGGPSAQFGFGILAVLWIFTTVQGVRYARARNFKEHRRWMIRSFALTFAAVTLRLYVPFFFANGFTYTQASNYVAWMCWVPNLIVVEMWIKSTSGKPAVADTDVSRWIFYFLLVAMVGIYLTMVLWSLPQLNAMAGGLAMFDTRPAGYTADQARGIVDALGADGRAFYLEVQHLLDTGYPLLMAMVLAMSFNRLFPRNPAVLLSLLAFAAAGFDHLENIAVGLMLRAGPDGISDAMALTANRWTVLKSGTVSVAMTALLIGLALLGWRKLHSLRAT